MSKKNSLDKITDCHDCEFLESEYIWTPDSFENIHKLKCGALADKKIIHGYYEHTDKISIPDFCPIKEAIALAKKGRK